jgi:hypothetical protein
MSPAVLAFVIVWFLGLLSWVAALVCYVRARRYYVGPRGLVDFFFPIGRLRPSNYTAEGASILRWQFVLMIVFLGLVVIGTVIAKLQLNGHQH